MSQNLLFRPPWVPFPSTLFHEAAKHDDVPLLKYLCKQEGADANSFHSSIYQGQTGLHIAVAKGNVDITRHLVRHCKAGSIVSDMFVANVLGSSFFLNLL